MAENKIKQQFIFTDLDGTLLDHTTYSHKPAEAMLAELVNMKIPVIPTTSKTYAELIPLRQRLGLSGPFIVENGAAVCIPDGFLRDEPSHAQLLNNVWIRRFTSSKHYWLSLLNKVSPAFEGCFKQFSRMSIDEICAVTGLTTEDAELAAQREYGEPVLWLGSEQQKQRFIQKLTDAGARPLQGGRFIHVSGDCDKGQALRWFMSEIARQYPELRGVSIALGDSQNDKAMLEAADIAVRIRSAHHGLPEINRHDHVYTSTQFGPDGWNEVLTKLIAEKF
jgi:mannosyl-3-phosphoglycerate phosphatase